MRCGGTAGTRNPAAPGILPPAMCRARPLAPLGCGARYARRREECENTPMNSTPPIPPRRRLQELLAIPERQRTDEQWDEINELEIKLASANREDAPDPNIRRNAPQGVNNMNNNHGRRNQRQGGGGGGQQQGKKPQRKFHKKPGGGGQG